MHVIFLNKKMFGVINDPHQQFQMVFNVTSRKKIICQQLF